ncbi:hypothetical protein LFM09_49330 [Lentzea alba]
METLELVKLIEDEVGGFWSDGALLPGGGNGTVIVNEGGGTSGSGGYC